MIHRQNMLDVIKQYALAADTQDARLLDEAFHENFQVIAHTKDGVRVLDKKSYLNLIREGKIGGSPRKLEILESSHDSKIGTAKLILRGPQALFHDHLTLLNENGYWSIVSNVTRVSTSTN
jgi:hypothetical protein